MAESGKDNPQKPYTKNQRKIVIAFFRLAFLLRRLLGLAIVEALWRLRREALLLVTIGSRGHVAAGSLRRHSLRRHSLREALRRRVAVSGAGNALRRTLGRYGTQRVLVLTVLLLLLVLVLLGLELLVSLTLLASRHISNGEGSGDVLAGLGNVEVLVDLGRDGLDLSSKFLLNLVQVVSVVPVNEVDGNTEMAKSSRSTNSMEIGLGVLREVKVDDHVDGLDIDTSGKQIGTDEVSARAVSELMEDSVSMALDHLGVGVVT